MSTDKRIPSLDGLRAVSILMVVSAHLYGTAGWPHNHATKVLSAYGHFGVQVFFVISGFLITTLLLAEYGKNGRISLRGFYRRRSFRILPASLIYILLGPVNTTSI
jgi:peptidoglycan/LPS O-acetylase OafA/YrhL